jgi:hypothetical protein
MSGRTQKVAPILVLRARAEARALLYGCNEFDYGAATDPLLAYAWRAGLIDLLGISACEAIICNPFARYFPV